ncbi:hypothetical protein [Micromonospora sp. NPDC005206]|uniref:hypothetical protein n=2 Tax=unclassified Micromonospora TaxID=2617518 RepID=UPI0033A3DE1A
MLRTSNPVTPWLENKKMRMRTTTKLWITGTLSWTFALSLFAFTLGTMVAGKVAPPGAYSLISARPSAP